MIGRAAAAVLIVVAAICAAREPVDRAALTLAGWLSSGPFSRWTTFGSESITAHGEASGATGWLGSLVSAKLYALNPALPAILTGICAAAAFGFLYARCARSNAAAAAALTGLCAIAATGGWGSATLGFELLLLLAFCALLDVDGPLAYGAIAVCVLWANVSSSAFMAPMLAFGATAGAIVDERGATPRLRRLALILTGSAFAMALTPGGLDFAANAIAELGLFDTSIEAFTAWDPASRPFALQWGFALLLVLSAWIGLRFGGGLRAVLQSVAAVALGLASAFLMPLAAFAIAPVIASAFARAVGKPLANDRRIAAAGAVAALACALAIAVHAGRPVPPGDSPAAAIAQAQAAGAKRIFCAAPSWCDYAVASGGASVVLDSRLRSYPAAARTDSAKVLHVEKGWQKQLDAWRIDAVISGNDRALTELLALDPKWRRLSSADPAVFVRAT